MAIRQLESHWKDKQKHSLEQIRDDLEKSIRDLGRQRSLSEEHRSSGRGKSTQGLQSVTPTHGYRLAEIDSPRDSPEFDRNLRESKYTVVPPLRAPYLDSEQDVWAAKPTKHEIKQHKSVYDYEGKHKNNVHFNSLGRSKDLTVDSRHFVPKGRSNIPKDALESHSLVPYKGRMNIGSGLGGYLMNGYRHADSGNHDNYRLSDWYGYRPHYQRLQHKPMSNPDVFGGYQMGHAGGYNRAPSHPFYHPSAWISEDLLQEELNHWTRGVVRETANDIIDEYLIDKYTKYDPSEDWLNGLLDEAIKEHTRLVVNATIQELAKEYLRQEGELNEAFGLMTEVMQEIGLQLATEAIDEVTTEDITERLMAECVQESCDEIARGTLHKYNNRARRRELEMVSQFTSRKHLDSIIMDCILEQLVRQGKLHTESDYADKLLNEIILNKLLEQYMKIEETRRATLTNRPIKKKHRTVTTNVLTDVLLRELIDSLDEDMDDIDEYEEGEPILTNTSPL